MQPDIEAPASDALERAYRLAVDALIAKNPEEGPRLEWSREEYLAELHPIDLDSEQLSEYAGVYEDRAYVAEFGSLFYQPRSDSRYEMAPMSRDLFCLKGYDALRFRFERDNGSITSVTSLNVDGTSKTRKRKPLQ